MEVELGNLRAGYRWSAARGDLEVATDIAAHAALMGFSVQLFETLAWAEELLEPATAADVRRLPRLYTAAGYACFAGRAEAAATNAHRATELEVDARYDACEPGYATFVEALGPGVLRRPRSLRRAHRRGGASGTEAIGATAWPSYVDGLQSCGRDRGGARAHRGVGRRGPGRSATRTGSPTRSGSPGMAFSKADARRAFAAWDEGVAFVREHRVHFFEGFLARDAARLHTSDGEPEARAGAVRRRHRRVPSRRQRAAADHHARQRARAVRAPRPSARRRRCSSARCRASRRASTTFPSSADLGERLDAAARRGARPRS